MTTSRQLKIVSSAPDAHGAIAPPRFPTIPGRAAASPRLSGNRCASNGIAAGCQRLLPTPTSAEQTSSSQYVWVSPISKYGTPTHSIEIAIGIVAANEING